jgi:hypothetical protein
MTLDQMQIRVITLATQIRQDWPDVQTQEQLTIWQDVNHMLLNCEDIYQLLRMESADVIDHARLAVLNQRLTMTEHRVTLALMMI